MIPDDIQKQAEAVWADVTARWLDINPISAIAEALMAERLAQRERDARIVEHRIGFVRGLTPEAAAAVLDALPLYIRSPDNTGTP